MVGDQHIAHQVRYNNVEELDILITRYDPAGRHAIRAFFECHGRDLSDLRAEFYGFSFSPVFDDQPVVFHAD